MIPPPIAIETKITPNPKINPMIVAISIIVQ